MFPHPDPKYRARSAPDTTRTEYPSGVLSKRDTKFWTQEIRAGRAWFDQEDNFRIAGVYHTDEQPPEYWAEIDRQIKESNKLAQ